MNNKIMTHNSMELAYKHSLKYLDTLGYTPEVFKNLYKGKWVYEILIPVVNV
jgi:hypothetical protein